MSPAYTQLTAEEAAEAKFLAAAERRMEFERRGEGTYGTMFQTVGEYGANASRRNPWVVEDLLPEGYLAILGGTSKAGKTCFATALAMAVATGQPFLNRTVQPGGVLWCAYEESEAERLHVLRQWPSHPNRLYITHQKPLIDDEEGLKALRYWTYKTDAKLIVVDPLYGATNAESLADGRVARRVLTGLKDLCVKQHCAALILHHITKDVSAGLVRERFADSNQILATASMDMLMDSADHPGGGRFIKITCRGRGDFANQTLPIRSNGVTDFSITEVDQAPFQI